MWNYSHARTCTCTVSNEGKMRKTRFGCVKYAVWIWGSNNNNNKKSYIQTWSVGAKTQPIVKSSASIIHCVHARWLHHHRQDYTNMNMHSFWSRRRCIAREAASKEWARLMKETFLLVHICCFHSSTQLLHTIQHFFFFLDKWLAFIEWTKSVLTTAVEHTQSFIYLLLLLSCDPHLLSVDIKT